MSLVDVLTLAVLAFVGARLLEAARTSITRRSHGFALVRGLRPRHFLLGFGTVVLVLLAASLLLLVPGLSFGWWTALGGVGNPVFGSTSRSSGLLDVVVPVVFVVLLIVGLPLLVEREEWVFRRGAETRSLGQNARWSIGFGLAHALVGIPVGAALALSIGGGYLTWAYLRAWRRTGSQSVALDESARAHLAYNLVILTVVAVAVSLSV